MFEFGSKNVVFIAPDFFGYDLIIEKALSDSGANVYRLVDRPFSGAIYKAISKFFGNIVSKILENYYLSKLNKHNVSADYVLVINGQTLSRKTLLTLKSENPNAKFILYLWDSLKNRPTIIRNLDIYDEKFSFDREDSQKYGLKFRALFYGDSEENETLNHKSDRYLMSFVGTAHSDRYAIVSALKPNFKDHDCFWYLYLQASWVYWWYKITNSAFSGAMKNDFMYSSLQYSEMRRVFNQSEIIVDIEHESQVGLTIRTFECMHSGKKMVTTNKDIINYDFYRYGNIFLIDRDSPAVPEEFINRPFSPYSKDVIKFYSVDTWIKDVLSLTGVSDDQ